MKNKGGKLQKGKTYNVNGKVGGNKSKQKVKELEDLEIDSGADDESDLSFEEDVDSDDDFLHDGDNEDAIEDGDSVEGAAEDASSDEAADDDEFDKHKKDLSKLKETDPDFYKYLQENDKNLLDFASDSESDDDKVHQPPDALEADSDESDFEPEEGRKKKKSAKIITHAMIRQWKNALINEPNIENIANVVKAFNAALARVKGEEAELKVEGSSVFNSVIEMCIMNIETSITKFLKLPKTNKQPQKSKKWVKVRSLVQSYLSDLLKLLSGVTSNHIVSVLLKHLHGLCYLIVCFNKLSKTCLKLMSNFWSSGEESVRVLAYLCILRLTTCFNDSKNKLLDSALKLLYISYVKNTRFVSENTLPQINFMRHSLADLFTINPPLSYQHAFLYIRQLAIHLRNAVTLRKKERFQTVYNWQYVNSLHLWVELLCSQKEQLNQLSYPLITIIFGCIKLIPTSQYIPLRFHCLNMLIKLSRKTDTYIPILPYILETFSICNLNMKLKKASMKPFDLTCVLRLSKGAMTETGYTDAVIENVFQLLIDTCYNHRNSISFPDMMVPVIVQLRNFLKNNKVPKYSSKIKPLLVKIEENSTFITNERNKLSFNLCELDKIKAFESNIRLKGTPFEKYWDQWNKLNKMKRPKKVSDKNEDVKEEPIYTIRKDLKRKAPQPGPTVLFPSDDETEPEISTLLCGPAEKEDLSDTDNPVKKIKSDEESDQSDESIKQETDSEAEEEPADNEDIVEEFNLKSF